MNPFEPTYDANLPVEPTVQHRQQDGTPLQRDRLPQALRIDRTLGRSGLAITAQRRWILGDLKQRKDHPDVDMVHGSVQRSHPTLSVDTVYRTISRFLKAGLIQRIPAPTRRARFDGNPRPHDHFVCSECERILDVEAPPAETPEFIARNPSVHEVHTVQRVYLGRCTDCRDAHGSTGT